ncbi:hypothetical protein O9929_10940 [Vibrio lentus]|nr:hypothetical protein [Vibrio lentus]
MRNVYNWRVKETDRLAAMAIELAKLAQRSKRWKITIVNSLLT